MSNSGQRMTSGTSINPSAASSAKVTGATQTSQRNVSTASTAKGTTIQRESSGKQTKAGIAKSQDRTRRSGTIAKCSALPIRHPIGVGGSAGVSSGCCSANLMR